MTLRLALIGDLHLHRGSPRYAHVLEVLDWTIVDALHRGANGIVFLGDICEAAPAPMEIADLAQRFGAIHDGGAWAAIAQGNHEHAETGAIWECLGVTSAWDQFRTLRIPDPSWFDDDGTMPGPEVVILLCPYARRGRPPFDGLQDDGTIAGNMRAAAERIADVVSATRKALDGAIPLIVLGHVTIESMRVKDSTFELHSQTEVVVPKAAFQGVALTAVGHIHTPQDVSADPPIIGVGSLTRCSFAEKDDEKSYTLVTVDAGRVTWERIPVPARRMTQLHVRCGEQSLVDLARSAELQASLTDGQDVKVTVEIPADQVASFDASVFDAVRVRAAHFVLEKIVVPIERVRAPELGTTGRLEDEVATWLRATDQDVDEPRRVRLLEKVGEVQG